MKYWIDTDPGVDDAIAIFLATKYLGNDIIGFSSVQGNFIEPITAKNLIRIINRIKSDNTLPNDWNPIISRGSQNSLTGNSYRKDDYLGNSYHGKNGLANVNWDDTCNYDQNITFAANSIVATAHKFPGMALFCIGPLTNIALALQLEPNLPKLISEITIMGGCIYVNGNETETSEFNFIADPEAAKMVFEANFKNLKLIPIDPCLDVKFFLSDMKRIKSIKSYIAQSIVELMDIWKESLLKGNGIVVYDAVALMITLFPKLAIWESLRISIDVDNHRGKVYYSNTEKLNYNAQVAIKIKDRNAFFNKLENLI